MRELCAATPPATASAGRDWPPCAPWAPPSPPDLRELWVLMPWDTSAAGEEIMAAAWLPSVARPLFVRAETISSPKPGTKR